MVLVFQVDGKVVTIFKMPLKENGYCLNFVTMIQDTNLAAFWMSIIKNKLTNYKHLYM